MNHSFYSADRSTHLKIVVAALVAGIVISGLALSSVIKAGKPVAITSSDALVIR
jgi:hypothetical protein